MTVDSVSLDNKEKQKKIKLVIWDLDNTLWKGVLLEDNDVQLRKRVLKIIKTLDKRGILQSIASKNEHKYAEEKLKKLGIYEYFLYPQINWNAKSVSVKKIVELINIGLDTVAFIDDQEFERIEVKHSLPEVTCIDALDYENILNSDIMNPEFITEDSKKRRYMYMNDIQRNKIENEYEGPKEEFLSSLNMKFTIKRMAEEDLKRAEELTVRTHQLNTTGFTYSYDELHKLINSDRHLILIATLDDKFGSYGKIGLMLVELNEEVWLIKLLLMSCRTLSRGVGSVFLNYLTLLAKKRGVQLRAQFIHNDRNRMMYITYKFSGFVTMRKDGDMEILEKDFTMIQPMPNYVDVIVEE